MLEEGGWLSVWSLAGPRATQNKPPSSLSIETMSVPSRPTEPVWDSR